MNDTATPKRKYHVLVREVHTSTQEIEADSVEDAIQLIREGEGKELTCEYSYTMEPTTWSVDEAR